MVGVVRERNLDAFDLAQELRVARGDLGTELEDAVELLDLREPERGREVVEAVVVAEARVREPFAGVAAALVGEALQERPLLLGLHGDRAALARRHLLVRVEGEDGRRAA